MKKILLSIALMSGMFVLGTSQTQAAQPKNTKPCVYRIILLPDGTKMIVEDDLTEEEVKAIYEKLEEEHPEG